MPLMPVSAGRRGPFGGPVRARTSVQKWFLRGRSSPSARHSAQLLTYSPFMAGLVAVISTDRRAAVQRAEVDALVRAYGDVRGAGPLRDADVGSRASCVIIDGHVAGTVDHDGGAWCAVVGKLHAPTRDPRVALELVDGQFAAVRYDDELDLIQVFNDPFGTQALFVAAGPGRVYVSTSATVLARHVGAVPDPLGAALFLRTGRHFGPTTHWQGVRRLDPATAMTFAADGAHNESPYWRPEPDERLRGMSFSETADHCAQAVLGAVGARLANEPCMKADITAGFDSRLVTAALARLGLPFTAHTSGETETVDVRLAREVARAGGFEWHQERLPDGWSPELADLRTAMAWSDGSLEVLQLSDVLWRQRRRSETCGLVITGGGGEHFGPQPWMQEFFRAGRSKQVNYDNYMSMRALTSMDVTFLRTDPTADVEQYMREALTRHAAFLADQPNTTQLDALYYYRGAGHVGAYRSASEAYLRTEVPCYYKDIFLAGFSSPSRYRNGHRLHRAVIERIDPIIAGVETERGGPAAPMRPANAYRFAPYYHRLGRTAVRKVRRRPAASPPPGRAEEGYRAAVRQARAEGLLEPGTMRSGGLYAAPALHALLARTEEPGFSAWGYVGRILTLELTLRSVDGAMLSTLTV